MIHRLSPKIAAFVLFLSIWMILSGCGTPDIGGVKADGLSSSSDVNSPAPAMESAKPESAKPEAIEQDGTKQESTESDSAKLDSTKPESSNTVNSKPDSANPESSTTVNSKPDSAKSGSTKPDITNSGSAEEVKPAPSTVEPSPSIVTISVLGDDKKGMIIKQTEVVVKDGDSVLDVLKRVTKSNKIPLEYRGVGMLSYVEGIGNLYEFDRGPASGWLFKVNGKLAEKSAGAVHVSKGDQIEWIYSIELNKDSENPEQ